MPGTSGCRWLRPSCLNLRLPVSLPLCPSLYDVVSVGLFCLKNSSSTSLTHLHVVITNQTVRLIRQPKKATSRNAAVVCTVGLPATQATPPGLLCGGSNPNVRAGFPGSLPFSVRSDHRLKGLVECRADCCSNDCCTQQKNGARKICARPYSSSAESPCVVCRDTFPAIICTSGGALARQKRAVYSRCRGARNYVVPPASSGGIDGSTALPCVSDRRLWARVCVSLFFRTHRHGIVRPRPPPATASLCLHARLHSPRTRTNYQEIHYFFFRRRHSSRGRQMEVRMSTDEDPLSLL